MHAQFLVFSSQFCHRKLLLHVSAAKADQAKTGDSPKETESFPVKKEMFAWTGERKRHRAWESREKRGVSKFKNIKMREPKGDTKQSNPNGTNHFPKSPWRAGGCCYSHALCRAMVVLGLQHWWSSLLWLFLWLEVQMLQLMRCRVAALSS